MTPLFDPIIAATTAVGAVPAASPAGLMFLQVLAVFCITFAGLTWLVKQKN